MAASSTRIFHSSNRHLPQFLLLLRTPPLHLHFRKSQPLHTQFHFPSLSLHPHNSYKPQFIHRPYFNSSPIFKTPHFSISAKHLTHLFFGLNENAFSWNFASRRSIDDRNDSIVVDDKGPEVAVVLLGWLGAKPKHLRRYVEFYNQKGIHVLTFVVSVMDAMSFDLGKKVEKRVERLTREIVSWLSNEDGRERLLIFHTFSNTGWLAYGAILDNLKDRQDLLERIKGCVVDSGGDPNIDPKVWAAGYTTAILKKSSSATYPSIEASQGTQLASGINRSKIEEKEPFLIESFLLFALEKLFSYLLNLPNINQRLTKIISGLLTNQPACPQLYLYSSGDKVIPFEAVESFIEEQRRTGKQVFSFNFGSSPHVDHFRTFPDVYASQLHRFLKECLVVVGKL
ncbi:hypothetical protein BUALT_Bualt11G0050900 [Buddleja alternifolia]|uniref:Transmembrane protein 53 n=1 Tax=Buddleja alternifolia TaxID=168488 RepID=A0AAV6WRP1_9LAMI|nr:hypothetical protein BUALT_Bualt11G0050900 [Buddleja alternifolia]